MWAEKVVVPASGRCLSTPKTTSSFQGNTTESTEVRLNPQVRATFFIGVQSCSQDMTFYFENSNPRDTHDRRDKRVGSTDFSERYVQGTLAGNLSIAADKGVFFL